jgi:hypothetical protein
MDVVVAISAAFAFSQFAKFHFKKWSFWQT